MQLPCMRSLDLLMRYKIVTQCCQGCRPLRGQRTGDHCCHKFWPLGQCIGRDLCCHRWRRETRRHWRDMRNSWCRYLQCTRCSREQISGDQFLDYLSSSFISEISAWEVITNQRLVPDQRTNCRPHEATLFHYWKEALVPFRVQPGLPAVRHEHLILP